ncbi:hypothetical protein Cob_v010891 [Colletotrichum orbiculare MAFF 240422]|uniref:Uncharacterized protein n=1 Tax=Colletotrichum orbiculare (strain 104-T / ATCC 96160 / CBS 514.97 / LARS 414 / MAFF 240422) TaxID=1213857 RepID=A0A484FDJ1_COLOR|nr:hypothetical protein Cob_v010891 [Colletotrichum orbiculare MAFF 240422]
MTIVVLVVGRVKLFWYPEQGPLINNKYRLDAETISNMLQLVAKIHELLIVASLSLIMLAMSRRRLITDGLRLGFLTGSYRVGDLGYLKTAAFWRQGLATFEPWKVLLSGFLVFATIMSTIVGPASAVLLIPTLDWYEFRNGTANTTALERIVENFVDFQKLRNGSYEFGTELGEFRNKTALEVLLAKVFGGYLTDVLAREASGGRPRMLLGKSAGELSFIDLNEQYGVAGGNHSYFPNNETSLIDQWGGLKEPLANLSFDMALGIFDQALPIPLKAQRYGYGTGQERKTLWFAQAMMFIYLGAVTIYASIVLAAHVLEYFDSGRGVGGSRRVQSVIPWSDMQDLFVLGLRTKLPSGEDGDLADIGTGVDSIRVWQKFIIAKADGDEVQFIFKGPFDNLDELDLTGAEQYR